MNDLIGRKVTIYSVGAAADSSDIGVIEKVDGVWLWLRKNERELLVFNSERIRVVKPFEPM